MKKQFLYFSLAFSFVFTACQKNTVDNTDYSSEVATHSDDQSRFSTDVDAVTDDANLAVESSGSFTGRPGDIQSVICDATIAVDTMSNPRTITITYNGTNCLGNRTRTGVVVIAMAQGVHWRDAGAVLTVTYQNLRITRLSDNKSITINGQQTYTNVSGGLLINLPVLNTITHTLTSSNMSVTFDNGSQRTWQVAKQRVFTYNNGIVITSSGMHTEGNQNHIAEWGTNRFGHSFTTATVHPIIVRQDCSFRVTAGELKHVLPLVTTTATFGLDANGNPTGCPGAGNYYMKIVWTGNNGNSHFVILPY